VENGEMKFANAEKERLETKQRELRKFREGKGIQHQPVYFEEIPEGDADHSGAKGERMWRFNDKYWEDRKKQDWSKLPDIYSETPYE
jgi:hypothetical protein